MDTTLAGVVQTSLTGWKTDALSQFGTLVPVALGLAISIAIVYFLVRHFRGMVHI